SASIWPSCLRNSAIWLEAFSAIRKAATASNTAMRSNGASKSMRPPGDRRGRPTPNLLAPGAHAQAGRRPLLEYFAPEAVERRRPSSGLCRHHAGRFDQRFRLDQAAEILLVQVTAGDRLHRVLQFGECEFGRQKFKDDRAILQFCTQPRDPSREN